MKTWGSDHEVYLNLQNSMASPHSTAVDLTELLNNNPYLATSLLDIVNSAFFGIHGKIDSVNHTIQLLGIGQTYELVSDLCSTSHPELVGRLLPVSLAEHDLSKMAWSST